MSDNEREKAMEAIRRKLALLPDKPGCYLMKNKEGTIIYIGKAKVLKNRVRSYFTGSHTAKTQRLVMDIYDFEYIVTTSNMEALLLECNLIKQHSPKYNVLLKDDKTFPYIKITNEEHPRLEVTRRVVRDKAKYFGPYPNAFAAQQTKKLLDRLYPLRKCRTLPDKVCLYYHIGQCLAPCEYPVEKAEYERMIGEITRFLSGGQEEIKAELQEKMTAAAEELNFERAKEYRDMIAAIDDMMVKQTVSSAGSVDRDVFGYATDKGWMCVQIMYIRQGKLIERRASAFPYYGDEYDDFLSYVTQYYSDNPALPKEILLPAHPAESGAEAASPVTGEARKAIGTADAADVADAAAMVEMGHAETRPAETANAEALAVETVFAETAHAEALAGTDKAHAESAHGENESAGVKTMLEAWLKTKVHIPQRGDKRKMVAMACDNAWVSLEEKFRLIERDEERSVKAVEGLAQWLGVDAIHRIEAFDNSNIQGTNPVSAMVVFIDGKPERKEYRKYKIKTVEGPDDYATMREVIRRRYERVLREGLPLPDLIVVDGGKGQISVAVDVLENELGLFVPVCGLVKDAKHKTAQLMVGDPPEPVPMRRDSQEFYLLQRIQEEVHRFAITFHRERRSKSSLESVLDDIPGIGEKRKKALLKHFGSVKRMREASVEDFRPLGLGEKIVKQLLEALGGPGDAEESAADGSSGDAEGAAAAGDANEAAAAADSAGNAEESAADVSSGNAEESAADGPSGNAEGAAAAEDATTV